MNYSKNKLYLFLVAACAVGYSWVFVNLKMPNYLQNQYRLCWMKQLTTIPCPSCGSTRSILSLLHGHWINAITLNPLGVIIAFILVILPIGIFIDLIFKQKFVYQGYQFIETTISHRKFAIPLIVLVIVNWIWNINKGL
jgi:hypothetical protein